LIFITCAWLASSTAAGYAKATRWRHSFKTQNYFFSQSTMGADTSGGKVRYYWIGGFLTFRATDYGYQWLSPQNSAGVSRILPMPR
jgi:hypothetical protein